jgi:type IV secretory pathway TraG/TraD family ATPase VirD4
VIKDFPDSVIATSTKLDVIEHTAARRGPVFLFNPEGLGGQPSSLRWNPVVACQDRETAINRAGYLLTERRPGERAAQPTVSFG